MVLLVKSLCCLGRALGRTSCPVVPVCDVSRRGALAARQEAARSPGAFRMPELVFINATALGKYAAFPIPDHRG